MLKWGIFISSVLLISLLKFSYDKYSVDKVSTKIYCHFYFRGITLNTLKAFLIAVLKLCLFCKLQGVPAFKRRDYLTFGNLFVF